MRNKMLKNKLRKTHRKVLKGGLRKDEKTI